MANKQPIADTTVSSSRPPITLEESSESNPTASDSSSQSKEILEAEPVGNFIKDRSLVLKSSRLHRFTQKYRDSVVDRILAGKVSISSLTANGEFWEAELESWIADKANRQEENIEILDVETNPRWSK